MSNTWANNTPLDGQNRSNQEGTEALGSHDIPIASDATPSENLAITPEESTWPGIERFQEPERKEDEGSGSDSIGDLTHHETEQSNETSSGYAPIVGIQGDTAQGVLPDRDNRRTPAASATTGSAAGGTITSSLPTSVSSGARATSDVALQIPTDTQSQPRSGGVFSSSASPSGTNSENTVPLRPRSRSHRASADSSDSAPDIGPSMRNSLSRVENALHTLTTRIAGLEQRINNASASYLTNRLSEAQANQNILNSIFHDNHIINNSLSTITGILDDLQISQDNSTSIHPGPGNGALLNTRLGEFVGRLHEVENHMDHHEKELVAVHADFDAFVGNFNIFVNAWDNNRRLVDSYLNEIFSQVSWMEPVALFFQILVRLLNYLTFWRWGKGGGFHRIMPLLGVPAGSGVGGGGERDGAEQADGQNDGQGIGAARGGQAPPAGQEPAGDHAAATPAPGQFGSSLRADGLPWQTYNPGGDNTQVDVRQRDNSLKNTLKRLYSYFLLFVLIACMIRYILNPNPTGHRAGAVPTYTQATAPTRGAWLDPFGIKTLFEARSEAQALAKLASRSADSVVACASIASMGVSGEEKARWFHEWREKTITDPLSEECRSAVSLSRQAAMRTMNLALRLKRVFGETWSAMALSTETDVSRGEREAHGREPAGNEAGAAK